MPTDPTMSAQLDTPRTPAEAHFEPLLADWLAARGLQLADFERSTFYSDSTNDLPLLECVGEPVATNPGPALERIAQARGWPVLKLFT